MLQKIFKAIKNPRKGWQFFSFMLQHTFRKRKGILIIIGMESGGIFSLMHRGYEKCFGFEANPERFDKLYEKYKKFPNIKLYNVAIAQYDGEITFNISNNNGASSSIGTFDEKWQKEYKGEKIEMIKSITIPCINLYTFCKKKNIDFIDDYMSDIQGMDLEVLKTMRPMIDQRKVGTITCEVTKDGKFNIYKDLPDNSESGFSELLNENYELIARGYGALKDNKFEKIPEDAWEMDCKWRLKEKLYVVT